MNLDYQQGWLCFGDKVNLKKIIEENNGQACYVYSLPNLARRYQWLTDALSELKNLKTHYALKANAHPEILASLKSMGSQVDVVSGGEIQRALESGFKAKDIIFSGVAKSVAEIGYAIDLGIKQLNVESTQELMRIGEIAKSKQKKIAVALRMNPEVSPVTHPYITTGMTENKFGMDRHFLPELVRLLKANSKFVQLRGLTMHIGSQLLELEAIEEAISKLLSIEHELNVLGFQIESLDIGGGVGIHYNSMDENLDWQTLKDYGEKVTKKLKSYPGEIIIEPGRTLVARCGVLLCQVEYIKETQMKNFAIVNTGMHHLMRPALYQANHRILPLQKKSNETIQVYDFVGPICESSDFLGKNRPMPPLEQGDFMAICDTGAYGFTMANNYNFHELPKEIILKE